MSGQGYGTQGQGGYPQAGYPQGQGYQTGYPQGQGYQTGPYPSAPQPNVGFAGGPHQQPAGMVPGYPPVSREGYQQQVNPGQVPGQAPAGMVPGQGQAPAGMVPGQSQAPAGQVPPAMPPPAGKYVAPPDQEEESSSMASAPPMENMDNIAGYGNSNFESDFNAPPPSYEEAMQPRERQQAQDFRMPVINEETARRALMEEVSGHCCWGKGPAEQLVFLDLKSFSAMHYTLESFTEGRSTKWVHEPYHGQPIDSPAYGPAPLPWDVQVSAPTLFCNNTVKVEVPHTATIKPCHTCRGMGRKKCIACHGNGRNRCTPCNGSGRVTRAGGQSNCDFCRGNGRRDCTSCSGNGSTQCPTCRGRAQLKCYIKLTVKWTNHYKDQVFDGSKLPVEKLRQVNGDVVFQEEYGRVWPVNTFPDARLNAASKQLVEEHNRAFPTERILRQRHKLRVVPITEVVYKHKSHQGNYLVYGFEHKAHITDYPSTCCGCCVIL